MRLRVSETTLREHQARLDKRKLTRAKALEIGYSAAEVEVVFGRPAEGDE